jgi:O-6-methylguanine DNA methyltransferase
MIKVCIKNICEIWFGIAYHNKLIIATSFAKHQQDVLNHLLELIPNNVAFDVVSENTTFVEQIFTAVKDAYDGKSLTQNLPLAYEQLPVYTTKVLKAVLAIPVGYVSSYGSVAKAVGGGPRAVGNVMASNPFAPIIPCHRVVTSDFKLGGYGGGLAVKFEFLKRECKGYTQTKTILINGQMMQIFPAELVFLKLQKKFPNILNINPFSN